MPVRLSLAKIGKHEHIRIVRSFRNSEGNPRTEVIFTYGRKDKAIQQDAEVLKKAKEKVEELNRLEEKERYKVRNKLIDEKIADVLNERKADTSSDIELNIGVAVLWRVWEKINLGIKLKYLKSKTKIKYDYPSQVFLGVSQRILSPSSRLESWKKHNAFIVDFSALEKLQDYYRVLGQLSKDKKEIIKMINGEILRNYKREVSICLYDVTTYSFESGTESEMSGYGISKDHKVNEVQVVLGLVIDENGIPIDYELFNGNTNEFRTMVPMIERISKIYKVKKVIVVADRGLNSGENLLELERLNCEFVIAQKIQNCSEEIKQEILKEKWNNVYVDTKDNTGEILYKEKVVEVEKEIYEMKINEKGRKLRTKKVVGKVSTHWVVTYSPKREKKDLKDLERAIKKAEVCIKNQNGVTSRKGWASLIKYDKQKRKGQLDMEKIEEKKKWAGYYAICTNIDINKKKPTEIVSLYRQLWKIEDSFRLTKTDLKARPVFVWNDERIKGHFLMCYIALVVERLIEYECRVKGVEITRARILEALRTAKVVPHKIKQEIYYSKLNVNEDFEKVSNVLGLETLEHYEVKMSLKKKLKLKRVTMQ